MWQGKADSDILISPSNIISFGAEEVFQSAHSDQTMQGEQLVTSTYPYEYQNVTFDAGIAGNRAINSVAFVLWTFGTGQSPVHGELGLRGEHFYLWNDNMTLNTYPVANPRFTIAWTPVKARGILDHLTLTAGSGLFSMFSLDALAADKKYGLESFKVGPNRAWFNVIGAEVALDNDLSFQLEGYYKQYFNRLYITSFYNPATGGMDSSAKTDGTGYATGFDLMIQKKNGRFFDGYLSYSFVISQYKNPTDPVGDNDTTINGEPLGRWYYPDFQRFHTLNLVLNWKPVTGLVVTIKASVATGTPKKSVGAVQVIPVKLGTSIVEYYLRTEKYDSSLRTDISCPVDLRISYSNYYRNSKIRWEYYVGVEDVFVNLYTPRTNPGYDSFTGKEIANSDQANFSIGIPQPSVGYKISY
jgi:hypothetical protein